MLKRADQYNLDWHRNKGVEVKKRGSISLVTPQLSSALAKVLVNSVRAVYGQVIWKLTNPSI